MPLVSGWKDFARSAHTSKWQIVATMRRRFPTLGKSADAWRRVRASSAQRRRSRCATRRVEFKSPRESIRAARPGGIQARRARPMPLDTRREGRACRRVLRPLRTIRRVPPAPDMTIPLRDMARYATTLTIGPPRQHGESLCRRVGDLLLCWSSLARMRHAVCCLTDSPKKKTAPASPVDRRRRTRQLPLVATFLAWGEAPGMKRPPRARGGDSRAQHVAHVDDSHAHARKYAPMPRVCITNIIVR